jgi:hypothetical protein
MDMRICKNPKCRIFITEPDKKKSGRPSEYCSDCEVLFRHRNNQKNYEQRHEKLKVGNPKQDMEILKWLRKKRAENDEKHNKLRSDL